MPLWNGIRCPSGREKKEEEEKSPYHGSWLSSGCWNVTGRRATGRRDKCCVSVAAEFLPQNSSFRGGVWETAWKPIKASSLSKQGMSAVEWGGRETALCWVLSSKTNQGRSSLCVVDWKRQGITYWWALVVQGETHASFKDAANYCFQAASSDT